MKICVQFQVFISLYSPRKQKYMKFFEIFWKKKVSVREKNILAPIPILSADTVTDTEFRSDTSTMHDHKYFSYSIFCPQRTKLAKVDVFWKDDNIPKKSPIFLNACKTITADNIRAIFQIVWLSQKTSPLCAE